MGFFVSECSFALKEPLWVSVGFSENLHTVPECSHVHIAYLFWAHFVASEATTASKTASEVRFDFRFGIYSPNFICYHVCLDSLGLFWPFF